MGIDNIAGTPQHNNSAAQGDENAIEIAAVHTVVNVRPQNRTPSKLNKCKLVRYPTFRNTPEGVKKQVGLAVEQVVAPPRVFRYQTTLRETGPDQQTLGLDRSAFLIASESRLPARRRHARTCRKCAPSVH